MPLTGQLHCTLHVAAKSCDVVIDGAIIMIIIVSKCQNKTELTEEDGVNPHPYYGRSYCGPRHLVILAAGKNYKLLD